MYKLWKAVALASVLIGVLIGCNNVNHSAASQGGRRDSHFPEGFVQHTAIISGVDARAVSTAYQDWVKNVSKGKYSIRDQTIQISHADRTTVVLFWARGGSPQLMGGETRFGKDTRYMIDPDGHIVQRLFAE
ncbi:MAG: hypothetical protein ACYDCA_05060 [Candidatus Tyrphobacter sp.]